MSGEAQNVFVYTRLTNGTTMADSHSVNHVISRLGFYKENTLLSPKKDQSCEIYCLKIMLIYSKNISLPGTSLSYSKMFLNYFNTM